MAQTDTTTGPKHRVIEADMATQIKSGRLAVGQRIATAVDVSRKYGVSRNTADRAIVSLTTKGYLERTQGRGTFVADWRTKRSINPADCIAFVSSSEQLTTVPFCAELMHEAMAVAEKHGYHLVFCGLRDDESYCAPPVLRNKQALGSLVLDPLTEHQAKVLMADELPHLFVGNHGNTFGRPSVRYDMQDAGYRITKELLAFGRGPVWLVAEPISGVHYSQELLMGYESAMLEQDDKMWHVELGRGSESGGAYEEMIGRMMASGAEDFCMLVTRPHAVGLPTQLARAGIEPERTTVVLVDSSPVALAPWKAAMLCELSPNLLAAESVRQILDAAQSGNKMAGKSYKLQIETVDDQAKPLRFSWQ